MPYIPRLCFITDSSSLQGESLPRLISQAVMAGVGMVQIREKNWGPRPLLDLARNSVEAAAAYGARIIVNDRLDVALAAGAAGLHLGVKSMPVQAVRRVVSAEFVLGVSCHSLQEALQAEEGGADYILLGPIFETPSKLPYGPPLGLDRLREVASRLRIPVLALGGMSAERAAACYEAGAHGIAAITLFQRHSNLAQLVEQLSKHYCNANRGDS